jgi:GTPase SAR1 family protein
MTFLVGNQVDNEDSREVSGDKANAYAKEAGIAKVNETSAKTGENVENIFITAAKMLYAQNKSQMQEAVSCHLNEPASSIYIGKRAIGSATQKTIKQRESRARPTKERMRLLKTQAYTF